MSYIISENINPGQVTLFRGEYYLAHKRQKRFSCRVQCNCIVGIDGNTNCAGLCYKYQNGHEIVFERMKQLPKDSEIVITAFQAACKNVTEQISRDEEEMMLDEKQRYDSDANNSKQTQDGNS